MRDNLSSASVVNRSRKNVKASAGMLSEQVCDEPPCQVSRRDAANR